MYYGGDPAAWILSPPLPKDALFDPAYHSKAEQPTPTVASQPGESKGQAAFVRRQVSDADHPSAGIGGHRIPTAGQVGGNKRVGYLEDEAVQGSKKSRTAGSDGASTSIKGDTSLSKEEEEARQKREAAKLRVQKRTLAGFGFG
eukprot:jgi/Botrbrau1/12429/Bobra.0229s0025.1